MQLHRYVIVTDAYNAAYFVVVVAIEVERYDNAISLGEFPDGSLQSTKVFPRETTIEYVRMHLFQRLVVFAPFLFPVLCQDGVDGNAIQPGTEFRLSSETWPTLPCLQQDLLVQVFFLFFIIGVERNQFVNNALVVPDKGQEFLLTQVVWFLMSNNLSFRYLSICIVSLLTITKCRFFLCDVA